MEPRIKIADTAIWFKHVESVELQNRLKAMRPDEGIHLEADGVIGRWVRMKTGKDGRPTDAIRPDGSMKDIWSAWYKTRRGEVIPLRAVHMSDDYLRNIASLFPEWDSQEDDEAFRDL